MAEPLKLLSPKEKDNATVVEKLREYLIKAEAGEITSFVAICEDKDGYIYTRVGATYELAIGLHARALYKLNQDWDQT